MMKTWDCQVRTKEDLTTDLMFKEIMKLRETAAGLSTQLFEVCDAIDNSKELSPYVLAKVRKAQEYRKSLSDEQ